MDLPIPLAGAWAVILQALRSAVTRPQFETWFRSMRLREVADGEVTFTVANAFVKEWVESYYLDILRRAVLESIGTPHEVRIVVVDPEDPAAGRVAESPGVARGGSRSDLDARLASPSHAPAAPGREPGVRADGGRTESPRTESHRIETPRTVDGRPAASRGAGSRGPAGRAAPGRRDGDRGQLHGHPRYPDFRSDVLLNDDYLFDNFVIGPGNQLAHAASLAVANTPGQAYNPLFLHGAVGLGKTHLLQAICHRVLHRRPDTRILYLSCETFVNQFISAVEAGELEDFRYRYRHVDMLLIDDIHFLARKERTQEEFFHTFNTLYNSKKQVVLSCDSPPQEIPTLEDRLVSRFKWGLVTEIEQPDHETRISIVRRKADRRGAVLPDGVAELIADHISTNVREIEGAVQRVLGYAALTQRPLTRELAEEALREIIRPRERQVTVETILRAVCEHYGTKPSDLTGKRRQKSVSQPRQVCMYLARRLTDCSLVEIGGQIGGRDHTTVIYANERIAAAITTNARVKEDVDAILRRIRAGD